MFKTAFAACIISLLAACTAMPMTSSTNVPDTATMGARSAGEGPGLHPFYGAAGR